MAPLTPGYWNALAGRMGEAQFQEQLALYKRREHLNLLSAWAQPGAARLLKTDLFEEAFGQDLLLDRLADAPGTSVGMDVSRVTTAAARARVPGASYTVGDVCALPFRDRSFDLIVSISTLDHLPLESFPGAIDELARVLSPRGCLILTLDSRHNPLHVLSNFLRRRAGMIYAEHCYTVQEVAAIVAKRPLTITDSTVVYHVPFPVNFLAKKLQAVLGARADRVIRAAVEVFRRLDALPTRFLTGRYIALRIIRS